MKQNTPNFPQIRMGFEEIQVFAFVCSLLFSGTHLDQNASSI